MAIGLIRQVRWVKLWTAFTASTVTANDPFSVANTRIQQWAAEAEAFGLGLIRTGFPGCGGIHGQHNIGKTAWDRHGAINRYEPVANMTGGHFNSIDFNDLGSQV